MRKTMTDDDVHPRVFPEMTQGKMAAHNRVLFEIETVAYREVYPSDEMPQHSCGPMSISHWGMIDLGPFGVMYHGSKAHWQENGETFDVRAQ